MIAFKRADIPKVVLRFEHAELNLTSKGLVALKRGEHSELGSDEKRKGLVVQFQAHCAKKTITTCGYILKRKKK